jgi:regulator of protease activity HflC (stomatin/prohibitin superfamily)
MSTVNLRPIEDRTIHALPGWIGLLVILIVKLSAIFLFSTGITHEAPLPLITGILLFGVGLVMWNGLFIVQPNQAEVLTLFGRYLGSVKEDGWYFTNPLVAKKKLSLRVHNFNSPQLKVNDADGNPIEIAAVVVWRVVDTAKAIFAVENYTQFVEVQSETAIRHLASQYPYDDGQHPGEPSLRGSADEVALNLQKELQARLQLAGLEVVEARLSHLAYSAEIAGAMLQRQQAAAIIAARQKIVEGAVSMVEMALEMIAEKQVVELDAARKAELVSSLLVVLTSDRGAHPMLPVGK